MSLVRIALANLAYPESPAASVADAERWIAEAGRKLIADIDPAEATGVFARRLRSIGD
jgi:hypothetical protein